MMSRISLLKEPRSRLDIFAGLVDGILNSLTLAAGRLVSHGGISANLMLKVAAASGATTSFVFFVAHYAELRAELVTFGRQLNLSSHGELARTHLGRRALLDATAGSAIATVCSVTGSVVPLCLFMLTSRSIIIGFVEVFALLALLGAALGKSFAGSPILWSSIVALAGMALTWLGIKINLVG